jgi:hypothetical protein
VKGVPNILYWSEDPSGLVAAHFSSILFSMLALEGHVTLLEAYALTLFATQVRSVGRTAVHALRHQHTGASAATVAAAVCALKAKQTSGQFAQVSALHTVLTSICVPSPPPPPFVTTLAGSPRSQG